jgi:hypothetical protein
VGEPVGHGAGLDDLPGERQTVNNRRAQSRVGECRFQERLVRGDRDGRAFFSLSENLEKQLGSAPVQLKISQLVHGIRSTQP